MLKPKFSYSENFLQWIWKEQLFSNHSLVLENGTPVSVINPGVQNLSDGPDFLGASLRVGSMVMHGAIELHIQSQNWYAHRHQTDENYNKVILHVVAEATPKPASNSDGIQIPTLNLLPHISEEFHSYFEAFNQVNMLPCASGVSFISEEAFKTQIEKAHKEYFQKKVDDFFRFYNPELVPSEAWKHALVISLFDGLGISNNRNQMQELAQVYLTKKNNGLASLDEINEEVYKISWNLKGVRANNHPQKRVGQALSISEEILRTPFNQLLGSFSFSLWHEWLRESEVSNSARMKILYATVFLPAMYALGTLFSSNKHCNTAFQTWQTYAAPIPKSLLKKLEVLPAEANQELKKKLGAVYQLNHYCKSLQCHRCEVLKKAISS